MQNPPIPAPKAPARPETSRRARRGLVAGYIHQLSARHAADASARRPRQPIVRAGRLAEHEVRAGV